MISFFSSRIIFFILLLALTGSSLAKEDSVRQKGTDQVPGITQLKNFSQTANDIEGSFIQKVVSQRKKVETSEGYFSIKKPNQFSWQFIKPYKIAIVSDGKTIWHYDEDLEQVIVQSAENLTKSSPAALLSSKNPEKYFSLVEQGTKKGLIWIQAKPKSDDIVFKSIQIGFQKNTPRAMIFIDQFDNQTVLSLNNIKVNQNLKDSTFIFKIPEGIDVVKQ